MDTKINLQRIIYAVENAEKSVITVFGDYALDKYIYSKPSQDEPSVETGLTAYQIFDTAGYPGIGGTITNNLRSLQAQVYCIGLVGNDGHGFELLRALKEIGADTSLMIQSDQLMTNTYMKPMRGENKAQAQEINRFDFRTFTTTPAQLERQLLENLEIACQKSQGVIISDQFMQRNGSVVTDIVRQGIADLALKYPHVVFYADSRGFISEFRNVIQKCNEHEIEKALMDKTQSEDVARYVTMGDKGIQIYQGKEKYHIPSIKATPPFDICGAGDATNAGIMIGLTQGLNRVEAAVFGACVSSITIEQIGVTGVATQAQVKQRLLDNRQLLLD